MTATAETHGTRHGEAIEILHVDDEPDFAELTASFLERDDDRLTVRTATRADDGLALLAEHDIDGIVSDYEMPGRNGVEFLKTVREEYPELPFILFTGKGSEEVASEAISAGVTDYLQKGTGTEQYALLANRILNAIEASRNRHHRRLFQNAVEAAGHSIYITDQQGTIEYVNPAFEETTGYTAAEAIGRTPRMLKSGEHDRAFYEELWETILAGDTWHGEVTNTTKDGEQYVVDQTIAPVVDDTGAISHLIAINTDITAQKRRKRDRESLWKAIETVHTPLVLADHREDNPMVYVNEAFEELTGYTEDEVLGRNCRFLQGEKTDPEAVSRLREAIENEESATVELRNYRKDGTTFWNEVTVSPVYDEDGTLVRYLGTQRDITDRKERERRLDALNQATRELFLAETREEIAEIGAEVARDCLDFEANVVNFYDDEQSALRPVAATEAARDLVGDPSTLKDEKSIARRAYERGDALTVEDVHDDPDVHDSDTYDPDSPVGSELYLPLGEEGLLVACSPTTAAFDQHDVVLGEILAETIDVALHQVERTEQLRDRERELTRQNDCLEEFASIVSHDLRSPLSVAEGRLSLLEEECDSSHVPHIDRALDRMGGLIEDLLRLTRERATAADPEPVDLAELVDSCWKTVETADAALVTDLDRTIYADESRLRQVFENLVRNAIKHGGEDVTVRIGELRDGFYVEDDGSGIPEEAREEVFETGYSRSETGTGLGLNIVRQVVQAHDWEICVTESTESGARFEISGVEFAAE